MGIYQQRIVPWLIDRGMRNKAMAKYRPRIPPMAAGTVLEVGMGAGLNIPYYSTAVKRFFGLELAEFVLGDSCGSLGADGVCGGVYFGDRHFQRYP